MQDLTPVGLSKDGTKFLLASASGEEYAVPVDRLRAALRGDAAAQAPGNQQARGQELKMESALRPRDIQSRIRAGESAEDVAAAAGTTVDGIMAFAAPVLAERAHVAQTAVKCSIRRASSDGTPVGRTLDEASLVHLGNLSVRSDDVEWDAWRREDGRWKLVGTYVARGAEHRAEFLYDMPGRYVVAENEEALLLTGEAEAPAAAPAEPPRRLSAVPSSSDELPLGDDAIELVRGGREPAGAEEPTEDESEVSTSDLTETVAAVREVAPEPVLPAEEPFEEPFLEPVAPAVRPEPEPEPTFDDLGSDHADADWITSTVPDPDPAPIDAVPVAEEPASEEPAAEAAPATAPTPAKKKGRSSVPSWDEIMFGGGKHE